MWSRKSLELWNKYHNPFYHWWLVRKYFERPKVNFYHGKMTWFFGLPVRNDYYNRFIDFRMSSLGWKDKYNSPRHEWDPYIAITFFRKWQLIWTFRWSYDTQSMATWEAILDYLYYGKTLKQAVDQNMWRTGTRGNERIINVFSNMTLAGLCDYGLEAKYIDKNGKYRTDNL